VGGLGPEGVAHFIKLLEQMGRRPWPGRGPEVIVQDFPRIPDGTGYLLGCNLRSPLPGLTRVSRELEAQDVGCIAIPCITANYYYRELCDAVNIPIINYVLAEVRKEDYTLFADACHKAGEAAAEFARGLDIEKVMCKYN